MEVVALAVCLAALGAVVCAVAVAWVFRKRIVSWLDDRLIYGPASKAPREGAGFLRANFAPVKGETSVGPVSEGGSGFRLPPRLGNGVFMRTGPNPRFAPRGGYHWFDGDGMVHAVRVRDGSLRYRNSWIQTSRLEQEVEHGKPMFVKIGELNGWRGLMCLLSQWLKRKFGVLDLSRGSGQANTALVHHARRLLALHEMDMPYALRVLCNGAIETLGRVTFGQEKTIKHFTAHPKVRERVGTKRAPANACVRACVLSFETDVGSRFRSAAVRRLPPLAGGPFHGRASLFLVQSLSGALPSLRRA